LNFVFDYLPANAMYFGDMPQSAVSPGPIWNSPFPAMMETLSSSP
jgi:hypothetical protein